MRFMYIDFSAEHDEKAELPMVTTAEGTVIVVSPEELNAELPIAVSAEALPKVTVLSVVHDENALASTVVQSVGIITFPLVSG
jgi:hypothetical protein